MDSSEKRPYRGRGNDRRRAVEPKAEFPEIPYPPETKITPKHLGFLHAHCGLTVLDIVNRYPIRLTPAVVHLGLYHYFINRETLDAELKAETKFNRAASLNETAMKLPRVGLASLAGAEEAFQSMSEADRKRIEKEHWKPTLRIGDPPESV